MKYLLTSAGIKNTSIHSALVEMLGKPIAEASALCIPTAIYPFPGGPAMAYRFISGLTASPMCGLGWKSLGVLELTALPSIKAEYWIAAVQQADALLVFGGHWITPFYTHDPAVASLAVTLMLYAAIFQYPDGVQALEAAVERHQAEAVLEEHRRHADGGACAVKYSSP